MEKLVVANVIVAIAIGAIYALIGIDIRKWPSWLFGVYCFVSGFLVGQLNGNLQDSLVLGAFFAFMFLAAGTTIWKYRHLGE